MYSGSRCLRKRAQRARRPAAAPGAARRRPPAACRRARPRAPPPRPRARRGAARSAASTSPSSMRKPRTFTWWSTRPRNSSTPSGAPARQVARAVQARAGRAGEGVGDEALGGQVRARRGSRAPGRRRRCTARPATPTGTGCRCASSTYTWVLAMGRPMGTEAPTCAALRHAVAGGEDGALGGAVAGGDGNAQLLQRRGARAARTPRRRR